MKAQPVYLVVAVFNGTDNAEAALRRMEKPGRAMPSAVVMQKDADEQVQFKDVGLTPSRGAVGGIVLGGVVGLATGGAGLALGALGGLVGSRSAKKKQAKHLVPEQLRQVAGSLGPDSSAIIAVGKHPLDPRAAAELEDVGAELFQVAIQPETLDDLDDHADEAYATLLEALAEKTGGQAKVSVPYARIHVVINPASGKDEPILNILNRVLGHHGVEWEVSITRKYGDATEFARRAAASGDFDLVVGYGGDGTQHEIANGVMGTGVPMGVLPGGTGNGFANEMGIPGKLRPALEVLCTSENVRNVDIVQMDEGYFVQRLYVGIEPEQQTSRENKDKYGTFAYAIDAFHRLREFKQFHCRIKVDDETYEGPAMKLYVVNAAKTGSGISVTGNFSSVDDGLLDVFILDLDDLRTIDGALDRMLHLSSKHARDFFRQGQEITIETDPDQPVWTDGEYTGRTPVSMKALPGALSVVVP